MLKIWLLGPPQVYLDLAPVKLARRKSRALLYYLAAHSQPVQREALWSVFWPDSPRPVAQQTLRTTLYGLRQVLGEALVANGEALALDPEVQVDARLFSKTFVVPAPGIAALEAAIDLYRGEFLEGFGLPDAQEFEDWMTVEREHFRRLAVRTLTALSAAYEAQQDYPAALASLERGLAFNPLQEDLQREAIRMAFLAGDRPGAILRYDELRKLLDEEMGVPPMAETRALYDAIVTDRLPAPAPKSRSSPMLALSEPPEATDQLPFTGRSSELQTLHSLARSHKLILIEGEAGIGKTRLAEEFIRSTRALAMVGRARELEQSLPYQPVIEALRILFNRPEWPALQLALRASLPAIWLTETSRLLPELAGPASGVQYPGRPADESRLWEGVTQFLHVLATAMISQQGLLILFLDDLHWADASTLAMLGYVIRHSQGVPVCFLVTAQPVRPRSPMMTLLQSLTREGCLVRIPLARLPAGAIAEIARGLSPHSPGSLAKWLQHTSEGNPYFLAELVREARATGFMTPAGILNPDSAWDTMVVPQSIYSLIQARLGRLSETARRVLDVAVAAGREFEFEVVARASGLSENTALDALDELHAAGLIRHLEGERFAFDHSLTMEVAYREVGELRHRLLHRRIAEVLENTRRDRTENIAGVLAFHFAEGNDPARAAPYAFQAGQQASRLAAWTEAIAFFEQALPAVRGDLRLRVLMALGEAHLKAGHFPSASEALRDALNLAESGVDPTRANQIGLDLARSLLPQARFTDIIDLVQRVLTSGRPEEVMAAELIWGAALSLEGADLDEAARHLQTADKLFQTVTGEARGKTPDDLVMLSQIKFELGSVLAQQGDLHEAVNLYREALDVASLTESDLLIDQRILALNNLAYHLHLLGDPGAAEFGLAGLRLGEEKGVVGLQAYLLSTLGEIALAQANLEHAETFFNRGLVIAEQVSIPERIAGLTANLGLLALQRGQDALAIYRLSTALGLADALGTIHLAAQIRLWLVPLLPPGEARTRLAEAHAMAESSGRKRLLQEVVRLEGVLISR